MRMLTKLLFGSAIAAVMPALAIAQTCDLQAVSVIGGQISANYESFASADQSVPIRLSPSSAVACSGQHIHFRLEPIDGRSLGADGSINLSNGSDTLVAQFRTENEARSVSSGNAIDGAGPQLRGLAAFSLGDLLLILRSGQRPAPGIYQAQVKLVIETSGNSGTAPSKHDTVISIQVVVQPNVMLSAAWGTDLNLGEIASNGQAIKPLRFRAYANTPYDLVLTSDNGFGLRQGAVIGSDIAYTPVLDNGLLRGSSSVREKRFIQPTNQSGFRDHLLDVVVPMLGSHSAGKYEDIITVSIQPTV